MVTGSTHVWIRKFLHIHLGRFRTWGKTVGDPHSVRSRSSVSVGYNPLVRQHHAAVMNATDESSRFYEYLTVPEQYFYLVNGGLGSIFNVIVLFIALRHADTYDKPRQVNSMVRFAILITWLFLRANFVAVSTFYG
uniref:7TM GPCR serpentine receptor class x (Srx) domain-containing protein n=1 Tax=Acrobeloides nanus TaxID=290746 RepID=A0A914CS79_9BILA